MFGKHRLQDYAYSRPSPPSFVRIWPSNADDVLVFFLLECPLLTISCCAGRDGRDAVVSERHRRVLVNARKEARARPPVEMGCAHSAENLRKHRSSRAAKARKLERARQYSAATTPEELRLAAHDGAPAMGRRASAGSSASAEPLSDTLPPSQQQSALLNGDAMHSSAQAAVLHAQQRTPLGLENAVVGGAAPAVVQPPKALRLLQPDDEADAAGHCRFRGAAPGDMYLSADAETSRSTGSASGTQPRRDGMKEARNAMREADIRLFGAPL
jgi:hypothetical protein